MAVLSTDVSYVDGGTLEYEPSIFVHFARILRSSATDIAITVAHQRADYLGYLKGRFETQFKRDGNIQLQEPSYLSWTYEQLHYAATQVVHSLHLQNVVAGSTVVCLIPNGIEWAVLLWASILGKFTLCSLDSGALSKARASELQVLLQRVRPNVIFVSDEDGANAIDVALGSQTLMPTVKVMLRSNGSKQDQSTTINSPANWTTLRDLAMSSLSQSISRSIEEQALFDDHSRIALILFTSGTTAGTPKGCPHTVRETLHCITQDFGGVSSSRSRRLVQTTNFRIIAPTVTLATWAEGGTVILPSAIYNPQAMLAALNNEAFAISFCLFIPAQLHAIVAQDGFAAASEQISKRRDLKVMYLGGDIVTKDLYNKACKAFPEVDVRVGHGMTEGGSCFSWPGSLESPPYYADIAPLGRTNHGTRLKIIAAETGSEQMLGIPLKRGEIGELHLWNESLIRGYLDGVNAADFYADENGDRWFITGDTALMNNDGWVYILGRKKDIIKRAGVPITPAAIESALDTYLRSHTSVVGVAHSTLGQEPVAVVKSLGQSTKEDVKQHVLAMFGPDYGLGNVLTLQELGLDDFPLNATGKILKRELLECIASLT